MSRAGGSAQQRYDKLAAKRRAGRSERLIFNLRTAAIIAIAVWIFFHQQYPTYFPWIIGLILLIGFAKAVIEPNHIRAWGIGAEGERVTERELRRLPDEYRTLHDRRIPGHIANIDRVVIGPGGVFVESKRMRGKLRVGGDEVFVAGRRRPMVAEVLGEVAAVEDALTAAGLGSVEVRPILFIQEADPPWFLGRPADIPIVTSGRGLRREITSAPASLDDETIGLVAGELEMRLKPTITKPVPPVPGIARAAAKAATPVSAPNDPVAGCVPEMWQPDGIAAESAVSGVSWLLPISALQRHATVARFATMSLMETE